MPAKLTLQQAQHVFIDRGATPLFTEYHRLVISNGVIVIVGFITYMVLRIILQSNFKHLLF